MRFSVQMSISVLEKHLASALQPIVEKADSYVKNSEHFTQILGSLRMDNQSIRENIIHLYGKETFTATKCYEKLRQRRVISLCNLNFLKSCRNQTLLPTFTRLSYHTRTRKTQAILDKASKALLQDQIRRTRYEISETELQLFRLHLKLSNKIHQLLWDRIELLTSWRTEKDKDITSKKLWKKLEILQINSKKSGQVSNTNRSSTVHNISAYHLSDTEVSVLNKGFNYAIAPKRVPVEEIVSNVEASLSTIDEQDAELIRQDVARVLRQSKPPQPNLSREEMQALRNLNNNENILIMPADKGNATVVMNTSDYNAKLEDILNDPIYKLVTRDPTTYLEKTTKSKILDSSINEDTKKKLIPREKSSRCPKFYGLPKIHKDGVPLRPIVSAFNSPLCKLEKHLASALQPIVEKADSYVKNSEHFTQILGSLRMDKDDIMASFYVKSLYPSIPVEEALLLIEENEDLPPYIMDLSRHCLKNFTLCTTGKFTDK
ncbi:uncharacterized protein LOC132705430 [Cylas formicarius]|uniref:uncharacterized protein LOC132705430 n=1 Tax=Cylas formicarius TaxID=197179 RepID=UPI002958D5C1|nr:uncharacterized protein LOC132705430 [Cylas formicarius]